MYCALSELECINEANAGIQHRISVIPVEDVVSEPGSITEPFILIPGKSFTDYYLLRDSVRFAFRQVGNDHGEYFTFSLSGSRRKLEQAHERELMKLSQGLYIVFYQDENNQARQLGTIERPATFTSSGNSGEKGGDFNGANWEFKGVMLPCEVGDRVGYVNPLAAILPSVDYNPYLLLTYSNPSSCDPHTFNLEGSLLADGVPLTVISSGVTLTYTFTGRYSASIQADADPTIFTNWTVVSGSPTDFQNEFVNELQAGSTTLNMIWDSQALFVALGSWPSLLLLSIQMSVLGRDSNVATQKIFIQACEGDYHPDDYDSQDYLTG